MEIRWSASAQRDLARHHAFAASNNKRVAKQIVHDILAGVRHLATYPGIGVRLANIAPEDVRRLVIGDYELRYELTDSLIHIVRIWHEKEDR